MTVKLLTKHYLEFLCSKGGRKGSSESTLVKMPHCWKLHVAVQMYSLADAFAVIVCQIFLISCVDQMQEWAIAFPSI